MDSKVDVLERFREAGQSEAVVTLLKDFGFDTAAAVIGFEESDIAKLKEFLEQKKDSSDDCEYRSMDWKRKTDSALRVMLSNLQSELVLRQKERMKALQRPVESSPSGTLRQQHPPLALVVHKLRNAERR